jgi:NDP-sugar pyrophosphorylase family protein
LAVQTIKAILLATSETNKLQPLTESMPAPMVPVVNRPVMAYMVELLARQNIKNIVVSVYHMAGQIEAYFGNGRRWAVSLEYALQGQPLGSAGSLKWAQPLLSETFIVLPADCLLDLDVGAALAHHQNNKSAATVIERRPASVGENDNAASAYIFDSRVLEFIPGRTPFDIQEQLLPAVGRAGLPVSCFEMTGYGNGLQSFKDYQEAQRIILHNGLEEDGEGLRYFSLNGRQFGTGVWIGHKQVIHPNARLTPPVYIGDNVYIGRDVELGPETVIGSNVVIDDEATISQSTILDGTYIGQLVNVEDRLVNKNLIIDLKTADYMHVTDDFLLGQSYQTDINRGVQRIMDIIVALPAILAALILSLPLALLLLLTTGRVFRTVQRQFNRPIATGEPQKETFGMLQFNAEGDRDGYNWIGRWLTRLELHRLPELWNLVKGDLQLVGVKPLSPEEIGRLNEQWQQPRHEQRPGLTGLWYTNTRQNSDLDEFAVADIYYMATQNWREDLKILTRTPVSWFRRIRS